MAQLARQCVGLIPAAGVGSRMGAGLPKQYLRLAGKTLLEHSVAALLADSRVSRVWVVVSPDDAWIDEIALPPAVQVLKRGGATRAESVLNGLVAMAEHVASDAWVLVHDAARPGLPLSALQRLLDMLMQDDVGGLLALPVADTVKRAGAASRVAQTLSREGLWLAQTPQAFPHALLQAALREAIKHTPTDEASAMEALGYQPRLVEGSLFNQKMTQAEDWQWLQQYWAYRSGASL